MQLNVRCRRVVVLGCACAGTAWLGLVPGSAFAGSRATSAASKPYQVAFVGSLSGADSAASAPALAGARAAANYVNSTGGVNGHQIHITAYNDQSSVTVAPSTAQQAVQGHPTAIFDTSASDTDGARLPVYEQAKIPDFTEGVPTYYPWQYNVEPTPYQLSASAVTMAEGALHMKNLKGKRVAYIVADDPNGHAEVPTIQKLIEAQGGQLVDTEYNPLGSATFTGAANVISAHADVVLIADSNPDGVLESKTLIGDGYKGPIVSNFGASATTTLEAVGSQYSAQWLSPLVIPKSSEVYRWAKKDHALTWLSSTLFPQFYSAMYLFVQGLKGCGYPCKPAALEASLEKVGPIAIEGGSYGEFGVRGTNHALTQDYELWAYKNKKFVALDGTPIPFGPPHFLAP
jgi:branched-chain amino acid transport system substrate-binding protein